jgi:dTDP-4-dehydrorhamnose 3,5-epimerase
MDMTPLAIPEVKHFAMKKFGDGRGFFCEVFKRERFPGIEFLQDNLSLSAESGTIRGLHYQDPPFAQAKLVTVLSGAVFDVAVDIRTGSPSFGRWVAVELTAEKLNQLLIPHGFAHGFCTLLPDTLVQYKVDAYYSPQHDRGILWDDPAIGIAWPVERAKAVLSDKDRRHPPLAAIESQFRYGG